MSRTAHARKRQTQLTIRRSVAQGCLANVERAQRQLRDDSADQSVVSLVVADDLEFIALCFRRMLQVQK